MVFGIGFTESIILGGVCLFLLVFGAEIVVKKLVALAKYYQIPEIVLAIIVLSIGTSLPELVSHTLASLHILKGTLDYEIASATVLGGNIGSDVVQQTLILGIVVLFAVYHKRDSFLFTHKFLRRDYLPMIFTTLMTLVLAWDGVLSRLDGFVLLGSFVAYIFFIYTQRGPPSRSREGMSENPRKDIFIFLGALIIIVFSAHIILNVVNQVVEKTGIGGSLIGVMTLGIASALPELSTAISGIKNKAYHVSMGTLIGSNVTNPLLAIGAGAALSTYWVPRPLVLWDLPLETLTAAALLVYLLFNRRRMDKGGAFYLIGLYLFYAAIRVIFFAVD